jgi:hypothetical protein
VTTVAFAGYPVTLVAIEGTGGSVSFSLYFVMAIVADEFENSSMNRSGMRSDCVFFDMN